MLLLALGLACTKPAPPPSILLVVLDTVRADATSPYGNPRPTTPQLAALAEAGVTFEDSTAPGSWTWPSHASLFTGVPPWEHGAHSAGSDEGIPLKGDLLRVTPMREDLPTLAQELDSLGYETVALVANRLLSPALGLTRGFGEVRYLPSDQEVVEQSLALLDQPSERPRFLFLNLMQAHAPYQVSQAGWSRARAAELQAESTPAWAAPYRVPGPGISFFANVQEGQFTGTERLLRGEAEVPPEGLGLLKDLYEGEVQGADRFLNLVLQRWTAVYAQGVVAVTSDHGEGFGERGVWAHSARVTPELVQVPLILAAPGRLPAGERVSLPVQLQDLYPSLLELAGAPKARWSLLDALQGVPRPDPVQAIAWPRAQLAQRVGGAYAQSWALHREGELAVVVSSGGEVQLYAMDEDPLMRSDLNASRPELAQEMATRARAAMPLELESGGGMAISDQELEQLRALGYIAH